MCTKFLQQYCCQANGVQRHEKGAQGFVTQEIPVRQEVPRLIQMCIFNDNHLTAPVGALMQQGQVLQMAQRSQVQTAARHLQVAAPSVSIVPLAAETALHQSLHITDICAWLL